jgi:hypothetical protein
MRQLTWQDLSSILREYEEKHNYDVLRAFAAKYYPTATRVEVLSISDYDDAFYFQTYHLSSTSFFQDEEELYLPHDTSELEKLLAASPTLRADYETEQPSDLAEWLEECCQSDFYDLGLYGPERGDDLTVDLTDACPEPTPVYALEKGDDDALHPDE